MRILLVSLAAWSVGAAAQAAPRNGMAPIAPYAPYAPTQRIPSTSAPGVTDGRTYKPYKPYSAYGEGSKSLTPKTGPQYYPGYKPYKPPFRERPGLSGHGGTFD